MHPLKLFGLLSIAILSSALARPVAAAEIDLDPKATYLHVCQDAALNAPALSLAVLGFSPGQTILIEVLGDWDCGPCSTEGVGTIAVFSTSATLLAGNQPHRVPGAIAAGPAVITSNTYFCNTPTDIPQDFILDVPVTVVIPVGATHLFVGARDSLYDDNVDPDADYAVRITEQVLPVASTTWGKVKSLYAVR